MSLIIDCMLEPDYARIAPKTLSSSLHHETLISVQQVYHITYHITDSFALPTLRTLELALYLGTMLVKKNQPMYLMLLNLCAGELTS